MTLPPESYNPKALQDIEDSIKAAKKIIDERDSNSGGVEKGFGDIATMAETVVAERLKNPSVIQISSIEVAREYSVDELEQILLEITNQVIDKYEKIHTDSVESVENQSQEAEENVRNIFSDEESVLNNAIANVKSGYFESAKDLINKYASSADTAEEMNKALDKFVLDTAIAYVKSGYFESAKDLINKHASNSYVATTIKASLNI